MMKHKHAFLKNFPMEIKLYGQLCNLKNFNEGYYCLSRKNKIVSASQDIRRRDHVILSKLNYAMQD